MTLEEEVPQKTTVHSTETNGSDCWSTCRLDLPFRRRSFVSSFPRLVSPDKFAEYRRSNRPILKRRSFHAVSDRSSDSTFRIRRTNTNHRIIFDSQHDQHRSLLLLPLVPFGFVRIFLSLHRNFRLRVHHRSAHFSEFLGYKRPGALQIHP